MRPSRFSGESAATAGGIVDHPAPATVVLLASLGEVDESERGAVIELLQKAQQQHPDDLWTNLVLAEILHQTPMRERESVGYFRAALARRPQSVVLHLALGHTLFGLGEDRQAVDAFRRASQLDPESVEALSMLGGILLRLDQLPEGLAEIRRAARLKPDSEFQDFPGFARLIKMDDRLPSILSGQAAPRDAAERAEYALVCQFHRLYDASARLYGDAFGQQQALTAKHRYDAAWAAVLAGTGNGDDAHNLDERGRAQRRAQALVWLHDEVDAWRRRLADGPGKARPDALHRISRLLNDPKLSGVRDAESLGRLPTAERAEWEALWRDLRGLQASFRSVN